MIDIAHNIIKIAFVDKKDKAGEPYIGHLFRVDRNVEIYCNEMLTNYNRDLRIIALFHDLLEDCPEWKKEHINAIFKEPHIGETVQLLTKNPADNYMDYIQSLLPNRDAVIVKLADLKDNMDLTRLKEIHEIDIMRVKKYHKAFMYLSNNIKL